MDEIKDLLGEEIIKEIKDLSSLEPGSEAKSKAIDDVAKLYKLKIEETKAETERNYKNNQYELERDKLDLDEQVATIDCEIKNAQQKAADVDRWVNIGVQIGITLGGWIVYDIWHRRGLKFEETGTVGSQWTRNLMTKMLPKK